MLLKFLITFVLLAVTVGMHAVGFSTLIRSLAKKKQALTKSAIWSRAWLVIWLAWRLLLLHMAEIAVWGLFYYWQDCFPDAESAFYFSGVTYTTVGYGDLVLPKPWRMLAPCEALIGILMAGLSTGLFFAVLHRLLEPYFKEKLPLEPSQPQEIHDR
jgi:hypothetical protein